MTKMASPRLILLLIILMMNSGTDIQAQVIYEYSYKRFVKALAIKKPKFSQVDTQVRIWISKKGEVGQQQLLLLNQDKQHNWTGMRYDFQCYNSKHCNIKKTKKTQQLNLTDWNKHWQKIKTDSLLCIPTDDEAEKEFRARYEEYMGDSIEIDEFFGHKSYPVLISTGGPSYTIEVVSQSKQSKTHFNNPRDQYQFYKKHGVELPHYQKLFTLCNIIEENLLIE